LKEGEKEGKGEGKLCLGEGEGRHRLGKKKREMNLMTRVPLPSRRPEKASFTVRKTKKIVSKKKKGVAGD